MKKLLLSLLLLTLAATPTPQSLQKQILFAMQQGHAVQSLNLYQRYYQQAGRHDFDLLEQLGLILLDQGSRSKEPETLLLTMFGAGIAGNDKTFYILEQGLKSHYPQLQMVCLNLLANSHDDDAADSLIHAMSSNEFLIRLEAAYLLAKKKHPQAVSHIESLMIKVPEEIHALFPQLLALAGTKEAFTLLRKMMVSPQKETRLAAIDCLAKIGRDDLLPQIRVLATHHDIAQQETCAHALGLLKDEDAVPILEKLTESPISSVKLSALHALYMMGDREAGRKIQDQAKKPDPFAISLLGEIAGSEPLLNDLLHSPSSIIRLNACLGLLELKDPRCLPLLKQILIQDSRDLAFTLAHSQGNSLTYWKIIPSAQHNLAETPIALELSVEMREEALTKALELPEQDFLNIAAAIFENDQNDLVPCLVDLLENLQTPKAIDLLKKYQQKAGAPLIRNYCNLALYRLQIPGPYGENLKNWVLERKNEELIRFRPFVPWEIRAENSTFHLTPQETSRLLIESFESLARSQNNEGIQVLLEAIQKGNQTNKYALAGLLLRSIQ